MSGSIEHYQPAALIGSFGLPAPSGRLREARVAVRRKATGTVDNGFPKAEKLAYRPGMYRLARRRPALTATSWTSSGTRSRPACATSPAGSPPAACNRGTTQLLFDYAATAWVRHRSFGAVAADHQSRQGLPALRGDHLQYARVLALGNQRPVMPAWRWRILHSPADAPRFMLTDRGWMYVGMENWPTHGLLLPMGLRVAILGYLDDPGLPPGRPAFEEHLDLCPSTVGWINAAAWADPYIDLLIAHPDDRDRFAALPDHRDLRINTFGPYRDRTSVGLLD